MGTEIMSYEQSTLEQRINYAQTLAASGLIPGGLKQGANTPANVLLVMETGSMLGIHPVAAMQGIHIIDGKPTLSPALMSAVVRRAGHTLRVELKGRGETAVATATLIRNDDPHEFVVVWDKDRAAKAGLWNKRGPWQTYPEAMMKARAISEVCREGATDALMGLGYVPEELGGEVDEAGEMIATPSAEQPVGRERRAQPTEQTDSSPIDKGEVPEEIAAKWIEAADKVAGYDAIKMLYKDAQSAGVLHIAVETDQETGQVLTLNEYLTAKGKAAAAAGAQPVQRVANPDDGPIDAEEVIDDEPPMALG